MHEPLIPQRPDVKPGPQRPDVKPSPPWKTVAVLFLAAAALVMAVPQLVDALSWPADPEFSPPPGWQRNLWVWAFFVGTTSFVLALVRRRKERRRHSRSGRRLAGLTLLVAILGACVWLFPTCVLAGNAL